MSNPALEVGSLVRATLVSKSVVEGAVFSFDEPTGMLILMEVQRNPNAANQSFKDPNVHVLNAQFISNIEFISETDSGATSTAAGGSSSSSSANTAAAGGAGKKHLMPLPRSVLGDTLPAAENRDYTKLMNKLKAEQKKRAGLYHDLASIDACDTFEYFLKLNPDLKWSTEQQHLDKATRVLNGNNDSNAATDDANSIKLVLVVSGGNILLSGNNELGGFSWKLPKVIPANDNVSPDLVARMTKQAEACATKTA